MLKKLSAERNDLFQELQEKVCQIFPEVQLLGVYEKNIEANISGFKHSEEAYEIRVLPKVLSQKHEEYGLQLLIPLSEWGSGLSQVIAILFVIITARSSHVIIIDEPQAFLYPGAAKKLIEILNQYSRHQYIISTHSPDLIIAANPSQMVNFSNPTGCETKAKVMDSQKINVQRETLRLLGISLSDFFGADKILWVEGESEEICIPMIAPSDLMRGVKIISVSSTGAFEQKNKTKIEEILRIYVKLSENSAIFPPSIGLILDSENKKQTEKDDLIRLGNKAGLKISFLDKMMLENYLIDEPEAISSCIVNICKESGMPQEEIKCESKSIEQYIDDWISQYKSPNNFHAAKLLEYVFRQATGEKVPYRKVEYSPKLVEEILRWEENKQKKSRSLEELRSFLKDFMSN
jgi:hypothetical protein